MLHRGSSLATLFLLADIFTQKSHALSNVTNVTLDITHESNNTHEPSSRIRHSKEHENVYTATADFNVTLIDPEIESLFSAWKIYEYGSTVSQYIKDLFGRHGEAWALNIETVLVQVVVKDQEHLTLAWSGTGETSMVSQKVKKSSETTANQTSSKALALSSSIIFVYMRDREILDMPSLLTSLLSRKREDLIDALKENGIVGNINPSHLLINEREQMEAKGYIIISTSDEEDSETESKSNNTGVIPSEPVSGSGTTTLTESLMNALGINEDQFLQYCVYALAAVAVILSISLMYVVCKYRRDEKKSKRVWVNPNPHNVTPTNMRSPVNVNPNPNLGAFPRIDENQLAEVYITPQRDIYRVAMNGEMTPMSVATGTSQAIQRTPVPLGIHTLKELELLTPPPTRHPARPCERELTMT